jgi:hypothetical protein
MASLFTLHGYNGTDHADHAIDAAINAAANKSCWDAAKTIGCATADYSRTSFHFQYNGTWYSSGLCVDCNGTPRPLQSLKNNPDVREMNLYDTASTIDVFADTCEAACNKQNNATAFITVQYEKSSFINRSDPNNWIGCLCSNGQLPSIPSERLVDVNMEPMPSQGSGANYTLALVAGAAALALVATGAVFAYRRKK